MTRPVRSSNLQPVLDALRGAPEDPEAWVAFYRVVSPRIRSHLCLLGERNPQAIEDLAQDTLFRFLKYCPWKHDWRTLPDAPKVSTYLREVVRSTFFDRHLRLVAERSVTQGGMDLDTLSAAGMADLEDVLDRFVKLLAPEEAMLLKLVIDGFPLTDIALVLQISYPAAGTRVHRLRKKLVDLML